MSVVFGALKHGKKQISRVDWDSVAEYLFDYPLLYTGSVGVLLTFRKDTDLFGESFDMASADSLRPSTRYSSGLVRRLNWVLVSIIGNR